MSRYLILSGRQKSLMAGCLANPANMKKEPFSIWYPERVPHFSQGCIQTSLCHPAPGRWWWSKPQRCSRRKRGRRQNTPHRRWTSPSGTQDLGLGSHTLHQQNALKHCEKEAEKEQAEIWMNGCNSASTLHAEGPRIWEILLSDPHPPNKALTCHTNLRWPPLSCGDSEECQQSPEDIVIVEFIFLPLPGLSLHIVFCIIEILAPGRKMGHRIKTGECGAGPHLWSVLTPSMGHHPSNMLPPLTTIVIIYCSFSSSECKFSIVSVDKC